MSQFNTPQKNQQQQQQQQNVTQQLQTFNAQGTHQPQQQFDNDATTPHLLRQQSEQRRHDIAEQSASHSSWWRYFQIINIFVSLLFGLGCLTLYPDIHLKYPKPFYLVIFYMAISILCFFFSLILMIVFYLSSRLCMGQQQQQQQPLPTHNNSTNNANTNNNNANNLNNSYSQLMDHSITNFQQANANQEQVPWCNVGWFPLVYYSTLYIAYFFYIIFSTTTIYKTWNKIPSLVSWFLIYIWLVGFFHVATALTLLFSRKFISRHIEEMEEADVYKIDDEEIQRRKQEILNARNKDIHNHNNY